VKQRAVEISDHAKTDLVKLYDWIADAVGATVAITYIERLETYIRAFDLASERGHLRDDVRPGLRVVGFDRRVTIAFTVEDDRVVILRIFYGGRNWPDLMRP
jgi:toxin ParE1/3/4